MERRNSGNQDSIPNRLKTSSVADGLKTGYESAMTSRNPIAALYHDVNRLRAISAVLAKHGLTEFAGLIGLGKFITPGQDETDVDQPTLAVRSRRVLEELGPTFIKLGQILSTRPDILPPVFIDEFQKLQDNAVDVPFEKIREQVEQEFGATIEQTFSTFDEKPLATASMAQVHRATLKDGTEVAVKVQRPGIEPQIISDLSLLYNFALIGEATIDEVGIYNPVAIVKEFERAIREELNFLIEAANTRRARANCTLEGVLISEVIDELTTSRVITQTFIAGRPIHEVEPGTDRAYKLVNIAMEAAFLQIFQDGFFHGDPHPGNMVVTDDEVAFLDWGLVGRISRAQQDQLIDLIVSIIANDLDGITRIVLRMGRPEGRVNLRNLRRDIEIVRDRYLTLPLEEIEVTSLMTDIMSIAHDYRIRVNPEYALLTKATATVEGILRTVYPDLDIVTTLKPYAERLVRDRYDSQRVLKGVMAGAINFNHLLRDVPLQMDQLLMDVEGGELKFQIDHPALDAHTNAMTILGSRILLGFIASGLIVGGSFLLAQHEFYVYEIPLTTVVGAIFLALSVVVGVSAYVWHFIIGAPRKLRLRPFFRWFSRK